jgi:HTH-type transcriptional regulator / antitoxin HipB
MSQDTPRRTRLADARETRINRPEVAAAYEQTRLRYELGEAVMLRREELGWSQRQLAERAGMSQPGVARFEAGGTNPTLPLLERLAQALGLTLNVSLDPRRDFLEPPVGIEPTTCSLRATAEASAGVG